MSIQRIRRSIKLFTTGISFHETWPMAISLCLSSGVSTKANNFYLISIYASFEQTVLNIDMN